MSGTFPPGCLFHYRCSEECSVGSYGQDCKGVCDCANGARCYNIDGGCLCEPGFRGPHCRERMCPHGTYGLSCEHSCLCNDKNTLRYGPLPHSNGLGINATRSGTNVLFRLTFPVMIRCGFFLSVRQLSPYERRVHVPARLGRAPLQRNVRSWFLWPRLPWALPVCERRRV